MDAVFEIALVVVVVPEESSGDTIPFEHRRQRRYMRVVALPPGYRRKRRVVRKHKAVGGVLVAPQVLLQPACLLRPESLLGSLARRRIADIAVEDDEVAVAPVE